MKAKLTLVVLIFLSLTGSRCKEPENPITEKPNTDSLVLKLTHIQFYEAELSLHSAGLTYPATLNLTRNGEAVKTISLAGKDTVLTDDSLKLSTIYNWQVVQKKTETSFLKSEVVTGKSADSTSHDFSWQLDKLGEEGSQIFDLDIISENSIWAGGKFYKTPYGQGDGDTVWNAMHWNGEKWEFKRVPAKGAFDPSGKLYYDDITAIKAFSETDIWFHAELGTMVHWNGITYTSFILSTKIIFGRVNQHWGERPDKLYFSATNGGLMVWNGIKFNNVPTGTNLDIGGMWGYGDTLLIPFSTVGIGGGSLLYQLNTITNTYNQIDLKQIAGMELVTVFYDREQKLIYASTENGIYKKPFNSANWSFQEFQVKDHAIWTINGTSWNDILIAGGNFSVSHFNGSTWKNLFSEIPKPPTNGVWGTIERKKNIGAIRGYVAGQSYVLRFKKL